MTRPRLRALVLAAGEGTRLHPLTAFLPKPLLPVLGRTLLDHTLERLAAIGCEAVAVNLHHLGDQIRDHLGEVHRGMRVVYSEEREQRLGTLGALYPLRSFLEEADVVLLINGDSLCRWPLGRLVRRHQATRAAATLLLVSRPDAAEFGGGVAVDKEGRILSFSSGETTRGEVADRHVFAGAHALSPELLGRLEDEPADIVRKLYRPLVAEGARLQGLLSRAYWHDLGTPRRYLEGVLDWARGNWATRPWRRSWRAPGAEVRGRLAAAVVESDAYVGEGARLSRSILLSGARVGAGAQLRDCIVGPGVVIPPQARIQRQVVVLARRGVPSTPGDSHVEGLVYSPLDAKRRTGTPEL